MACLRIEHCLTIVATCPVDGSTDVYETTIVTAEQVDVEQILVAVRACTKAPIYQEHLTGFLADDFHAEVTTVGRHSGVTTTVRAVP